MTTYTNIPDGNLDTDKPARSIDALALRDNPIAISEGASGAPRNQPASLTNSISGSEVTVGKRSGNTNSTSYIKIADFTVPSNGTINAWVFLKTTSASGTAYSRVYLNGVAVGVERSTTSLTGTSFNEAVAVTPGDRVQCYIRNENGAHTTTADFRIRKTITTCFDIYDQF